LNRIDIAIAGASGYTGMEAMRYLLAHPDFRVTELYGESSAGKRFDAIYPAFKGYCDLEIRDIATLGATRAKGLVLALPHGESAKQVGVLDAAGFSGKIMDIGSDHRLNGTSGFVYGIVELNRDAIRGADRVANPGCFASALQLGAFPLTRGGLVERIFATGITGSSGSGAGASSTVHYSTRYSNFKAYKVFEHQHMAEVAQFVDRPIHFVPVSGPVVRGIWMTLSGQMTTDADVAALLASAYSNHPFIRLREGLPELKPVLGTPFTDIGVMQQGRTFAIGVAIDNLGKGAAGQAVQNLNLMFGLPEDAGLRLMPIVL
jgi:N-acetyl-gamma-glutamyl-phosphate reductase